MKNADSIFTKSRMNLDNSVWLTMLVMLFCSTFFLGFKIITHVDCSSFEISTSCLRQQANNVFYVGEAITFLIPAKPADKVEWNFGDGTPVQDGKNVMQHNFLKEDDYQVSCIVNNKCTEAISVNIISKPSRQVDTMQLSGLALPIIGADTVLAGVTAHYSTSIKANYSYQWSLSGSPDIKTTPAADFNFYRDGVQMLALTIDGNKRFTKTIVVLYKKTSDASIVNTGGSSSSRSIPIPPPAVNSISPVSGGPGTKVTINGSFFNGAKSVSFGGIEAKSFQIVSSNEIAAIVSDGQTGNVAVTTNNGVSPASQQFTYITPKAAPATPPAPATSANAPVRKGISDPNLFTLLKKVANGDPNVSTKIIAEYLCGGENTLVKINSEKKATTLSALCERLQSLKEVTVESAKINWDPNNPDCETNILVTYSQPKKFLGVKWGKKRD